MSPQLKTSKQTPLMAQYFKLKVKYRDAILLFQVGDFYETFGEDAKKAAETLGIVLTKRNNGSSKIELAGFPHHALDMYLPKLVKAGFRVAICEQLEKPDKNKKLVRRGVTELVTPGLHQNDSLLEGKKNNYLACVHVPRDGFAGLALIDISTGEFLCYQGERPSIENLLQSFDPAEVIHAHSREEDARGLINGSAQLYGLEDWVFTDEYGRERLLQQFDMPSLKGFGIEELGQAQVAAAAILHYLDSTSNERLSHIRTIARIQDDEQVWLDRFTVQNLEIIEPLQPRGKSLLQVMDRTVNSMGGRLMRKWLSFPLTDADKIMRRQSVVTKLYEDHNLREDIRERLGGIGDLERLGARISSGKISPRQLEQLAVSLVELKSLKQQLDSSDLPALAAFYSSLDTCDELLEEIERSLGDDPPAQLGKGMVIRRGKSDKLDEWRDIRKNSKQLLLEIQQKEASATGISKLKVGYNQVFGYYLEVTNRYKDRGLVPDHWVRKQTLTNSERYATDELKKLEDKILQAEERIQELEAKLFEELVQFCSRYLTPLQINAEVLAQLDCLASFSETALVCDYCAPELNDGHAIEIVQGRHPVIEQTLPVSEKYIPNDLSLDDKNCQIAVITGPNMSGKSALLRQTALICLLAQTGSYVPAKSARLGILDRIFTRVGASDNLSSGESTFMVEMNETASILNNLSSRSLVLLDEIGRGTSTFDGISIAWSIAEFMHEHSRYRPRSLFATHYHELNELAHSFSRIENFHVSTRQIGNKVIFLRTLKPGGTSHSFGIHVARMAGMPAEVLQKAAQVLKQLEEKHLVAGEGEVRKTDLSTELSSQLQMFHPEENREHRQIIDKIIAMDLHTKTPIECMLFIKELQEAPENAEK